MNLLYQKIKLGITAMALAVVALISVSCNSIFDYEGDCSVTYRVQFRYEKNMKFADAFHSEVGSVSLYVLDSDGAVVWYGSDSGEELASGNYSMAIDVAPGTYELIAWCGLAAENSLFSVAPEGALRREDLTCTLMREYDEEENAVVKSDPQALYHGRTTVTFTDEPGVQIAEVPLTKNTNVVRVVLQHLSGEPVDKDAFTFTITDCNGRMNYDNSLLEDEPLTYYAWRVDSGVAGISPESRTTTSASATIAELTTARLCMENRPLLNIYNSENGKLTVSIPLIDYALLVKGHYNRNLSDQDYLDYQDEYNMTFFLDEGGNWIRSFIYINSWKVVLQDVDIN